MSKRRSFKQVALALLTKNPIKHMAFTALLNTGWGVVAVFYFYLLQKPIPLLWSLILIIVPAVFFTLIEPSEDARRKSAEDYKTDPWRWY